jgi:hypothetical protein
MTKITAYKGFDRNLQCRGFQFEIGKTYTHEGKVEACKSGFHAIEGHPLEVFGYYAPGVSRFGMVELDGDLARHGEDSKVAGQILTVGKEIGISDLVRDAVKFVMDRSKPEGEQATGDQGAASATGYQGAASAIGYRGAASATGDQGAAYATGNQGAAMASGYLGSVSGADGNALFAVERETWDGPIVSVACGIVGQGGIVAGVWYRCEDGKLVEVE